MIGLLNIDKPAGLTSRDVVDAVSRRLKVRRVGHAGTLDPMATGVLIVAIGAATRLVGCLQEQSKEYRAEFLLGRRSDTDDVTGQVVDVPGERLPDLEAIAAALKAFVGRISQVPPTYSAVHVGGERAYAKARRSEDFTLAPREVVVQEIEILACAPPRLELRIACGSGTYIRSIGRDLGNVLGCGAVMSSLVRTRIGSFTLEDAAALESLTVDDLRPPLAAVSHWPRQTCSPEDVVAIRQGRTIPRRTPGEPMVALVNDRDELIALATGDPANQRLHPHLVLPLSGKNTGES